VKLVVTGTAPPELFDVATDPAERRSLAAERPEVVKRLRAELTEWLSTETDAAKWGRQQARPKK
jgi:hypothetical protein